MRIPALLASIALLLPTVSLPQTPAKQVLIIDSFGPGVPPFGVGSAAFRTTLERELGQPVNIYQASLDSARFTEPGKQEAFADFLQQRFSDRRLDLVTPVSEPATQFAIEYRNRLFPETPIVSIATDRRRLTPAASAPGTLVVTLDAALPATVENVLRVLPETRTVAMIIGTSPLERFWVAELERELEPFRGRVDFIWLNELGLSQMRERVGTLPPRSAIIFWMLVQDGAGVPHDDFEALDSIHASANAPLFGYFRSQFGHGIVGGSLYGDHEVGAEGARAAIEVLNGEVPDTLAVRELERGAPVYDARELERWGISEERLPAGAQVLHRQPTLWEAYRSQAVMLGALIILQSLLIAALLVQAIRRRRAETALNRSRDDFRRVSESTAAVPWEADPDTWLFTFVGPQAVKLLGYPMERWYEKDFWVQQIHPEDREAAIGTCLACSQTLDDFEFEYRILASSGAAVWVHDVVHCERRNGKLTALRGLLLDITERKRAERNLRESEERFRLMADTAPVLIWMSGPDGLCTFFNKGWLDFTGRTLEQELGNGWIEDVHREDLDRCLANNAASFRARREFKVEYRLRNANGSYRLMLGTGVPRFASDGGFAGYIGTAIDITDLKRAEADARQQRAELAHVSRVSALGELAASLAHELNQPLTAILSNAQTAQRFLASGEAPRLNDVREILRDIIEDDRRADDVIRRVRALAKKERPQLAPLDLAGALREVAALVHSDAVLRNVRLHLDLHDGLPLVRGDKVQLEQVTLNLLLNAFDAMKDTPAARREVLLRAKSEGRTVEVAVRDHGTGLSADVERGMFQAFYTTKHEGLGMGLAISRSIVEAHHGRMWAENHASGGATFYFTVPVEEGA